jgi:hypothetical protein
MELDYLFDAIDTIPCLKRKAYLAMDCGPTVERLVCRGDLLFRIIRVNILDEAGKVGA